MVFQENIIVRIRFITDKEGKVHRETTRTVQDVKNLGDRIKINTKIFRGHKLITKETATKMRGFRMELLSVMFFGMQLQRIFKGLTQTSMEWMGVNDILSAFLGLVFLPVANAILNTILWLWDIWDKLPEPIKEFIRILVVVIGALGTALFIFGAFKLGIIGLGMAFGPILAILGGPLTIAILAIIGLVAALWYAWNANLGGIQEKTRAVFDWISEKISYTIGFIKYIIFSFLDLFKAIWEGRWSDAWTIIQNIFGRIKDFIGGLGSWFYNIAKDLLQRFIDGIWSLAGAVKDAFWNILPDWLKNAIKGIGAFAGTIASFFRGLFPMQHGGIVTRPTPALIGEKGPEAVIPLDRIGNIGGIYVNINTTTIGGNVDTIAREVAEKFAFELSRVRY